MGFPYSPPSAGGRLGEQGLGHGDLSPEPWGLQGPVPVWGLGHNAGPLPVPLEKQTLLV